MAKTTTNKTVTTLKHDEATRKNIPTAEYQSVMQKNEQDPVRVAYERGVGGLDDEKQQRNRDLDPQLVWRGKDEQDWSDLVVHAPPLYIQEKVHPKALIDDLLRETRERKHEAGQITADLFADFNGIPQGVDKTEFYQHEQNWSNRMILGDSLQVMASLAEREGLRGKVQCIYFDPPYGIKFNSNFQWSTTSRDVKDGKADHITREPEQVKAFRDTWRDGIHSYLTYLRDRLTVARDLLTESGSIFVQIGDENVHRVRAVMDEVFGDENFVAMCTVRKTTSDSTEMLGSTCDFVLWFAKKREAAKARTVWAVRGEDAEERYSGDYGDGRRFQLGGITSSRPPGEGDLKVFKWFGRNFEAGNATFKTTEVGLTRAAKADRVAPTSGGKLRYRRFHNDFGYTPIANLWTDISGAVQSRSDPKIYVVQSSTSIVERCIFMATDPGDLVLDPTCGSGTTATVAEQWGRRWITIDTSRVALALARARIMGARYPFYLLADSREGREKEWSVARGPWSETGHQSPVTGHFQNNIRHGFVYERVPHITLKSIANNAEIDVIWDQWQLRLEPLREKLNAALKKTWQEWEIPREADAQWPDALRQLHADWWQARVARQQEIDKSIAAKAEFEYLYDKPYEDKKIVRVAGPFTVESLSPHRVLGVDENDELIDPSQPRTGEPGSEYGEKQSFPQMILENLKVAGVQQAHKEDRITFTSLNPWPG
jgi:adenine-specific DNA-methyltransferase